jgi:3-oxoadipate enol-lactonase/4-carboxymuconolactone decarboxylase
MPFSTHQGARIYWRLEGAAGKPALVLLNSIGTDMSLWDRAAPHLAAEFRLLRIDTRGHGASDVPVASYTLDLLAGDVAAVMDAAGIETAAVCGVSLGGMIAMALALSRPERVSALVLACTSPRMDREAWRQRLHLVHDGGMGAVANLALERFFSHQFRGSHPDEVATVRANLLAMNPDGYAGCGAAIRDMDLVARLPEIRVPTLVIGGSKDISTPFAGHGEVLLEAIPGAQGHMLPAAHLACLEAPTAFAGAVIRFLRDGAAVEDAANALYEAGLKTRRKVLGDTWVDRSLSDRTPFNHDFQAMITRTAWNEIWNRPGLDHRTRRLLVLAITAALGRWEEFRLHVRAGLEQGGFSEDELKETLMQLAVYAGVPAANTAFHEAAEVMAALTPTASPPA